MALNSFEDFAHGDSTVTTELGPDDGLRLRALAGSRGAPAAQARLPTDGEEPELLCWLG